MQQDWREQTLTWWGTIPRAWKQAFCWAFAVNIFVFFFDLANFPLGDHDVGYVDGIPLLSGGRAGRWFAPFLYALSGHVQIPVYTQCLSIVVQIIAAMGAVLLWRPQATAWQLFVGASIVSCLPAVTDFYYYHFQSLTFTAAQLFMVLALHCCLQQSEKYKWYSRTLAVVLCTCAMGSYQSSVMTWTTCFWGLVCVYVADETTPLKQSIARLIPAFLCFLMACALYSLSLRLYPLVGLSLGLYQFQTVHISDIPARILGLFQNSYSLLLLPQGYFSMWMKLLLLAGMIGGAWALIAAARQRRYLLLLGLIVLPLAAESQFLVSASEGWGVFRFLGLGLSYCYIFFFLALLVSERNVLRNLAFVLFLILLPCMAINSLDEQVTHVRQTQHDFALLNRVMGRLEALPEFDPHKTYNLVQLGKPASYVTDSRKQPLAHRSVGQFWNPGYELWQLARYLKLGDRLNEELFRRPDLLRMAVDHVRDKQPFPHRDGVSIVGDTIILYFDTKALPEAERSLARGAQTFKISM